MEQTPRSDDGTYGYDDDDEAETETQAASPSNEGRPKSQAQLAALEDDDDEDDDANELAEMFAKVQNIQQAEGLEVKPVHVKPPPSKAQLYDQLEVVIPERNSTKRSDTTPRSAASSSSASSSVRSRSSSPASAGLAATRSPDGITTLSRKALSGGLGRTHVDVLSGVKKPELFKERLLQTVKQQPQTLEQMKQKVVAAAPAAIAKRIETLSEPKKSDSGREFALDDDERHCRFRPKKKKGDAGGRDAYDDDEASGHDRSSDFLARMEATERNRQKASGLSLIDIHKLELTRGEKEYMANLSKKVCPKCDVSQSYSEYRDKKKRCQTCGSEFRVPQAWGDVGSEFISRISEDSRTREEKKDEIRRQVVQAETAIGRVPKSATQQYYEKSVQQRNEHKTFLDRNYTTSATKLDSTSSSTAKTRQAQLQLQMQLQAQRAKLLGAAQPPIY